MARFALAAVALAALLPGGGCGSATMTEACAELYVCDTSASSSSAAGGGSGGSGGSDAGSGGTPIEGCSSAAACPAPPDPECGEAICEKGVCRLDLKPFGEIASQIRGDCVTRYCDGLGHLIDAPDGHDVYNDGNQCTSDFCDGAVSAKEGFVPMNTLMPDGTVCPETGTGVCFEGRCSACMEAAPLLCSGGLVCAYASCVPMHCTNGVLDADSGETDTDCGAACHPCDTGKKCVVAADCRSGVCAADSGGGCEPPSCTDGAKNDSETGVDCGGPPSCPRCPAGEGCLLPSDCDSQVCWAGLCILPKCDDGVRNGNEETTDCGGSCPACL